MPSWRYFEAVARSAEAILREKISPLDVAFQTGMVEEFYSHIFDSLSGPNQVSFVQFLVHERHC